MPKFIIIKSILILHKSGIDIVIISRKTFFVLKGELVYRYLDKTNKEQYLKLKQGDLLLVEKDIHTFENQTDEVVEFIVFRYLPSYKKSKRIDSKTIKEND